MAFRLRSLMLASSTIVIAMLVLASCRVSTGGDAGDAASEQVLVINDQAKTTQLVGLDGSIGASWDHGGDLFSQPMAYANRAVVLEFIDGGARTYVYDTVAQERVLAFEGPNLLPQSPIWWSQSRWLLGFDPADRGSGLQTAIDLETLQTYTLPAGLHLASVSADGATLLVSGPESYAVIRAGSPDVEATMVTGPYMISPDGTRVLTIEAGRAAVLSLDGEVLAELNGERYWIRGFIDDEHILAIQRSNGSRVVLEAKSFTAVLEHSSTARTSDWIRFPDWAQWRPISPEGGDVDLEIVDILSGERVLTDARAGFFYEVREKGSIIWSIEVPEDPAAQNVLNGGLRGWILDLETGQVQLVEVDRPAEASSDFNRVQSSTDGSMLLIPGSPAVRLDTSGGVVEYPADFRGGDVCPSGVVVLGLEADGADSGTVRPFTIFDEQGSTIDELAVEATDVICVG